MTEFVQSAAQQLASNAPSISLTASSEADLRCTNPARRTARTAFQFCTAALAIALLVGCGDTKPVPLKVVPVTGSVKFEGKPASGAIITLHPKDSSIPEDVRPNAIADEGGHFDLGTYSDADGAPVGEYNVVITWRPLVAGAPGPNRLPTRYSQPETSQLTALVEDTDTELKPFELTP